MANYEIPENPVFTEEVRQLEPTDRAHASIFNNILVKLFQNGIFNRKKQQEHESNKQNPHATTPAQIGAATTEALELAYQNGNAYADTKIAELVNGAPTTLDTLKEIADAMTANDGVVEALEAAIGSKASKAEFDSHNVNKTVHITAGERTKWNTIDSALSATSTNPIQNKAVKAAMDAQNNNFAQSVTELNDSLSKICDYTLLYYFLPSGNSLTANLSDNLSNYRFVCVFYNAEYTLVPMKLFVENINFYTRTPDDNHAGYHYTLLVSYVNDITLNLSRNNTGMPAKIYGIK